MMHAPLLILMTLALSAVVLPLVKGHGNRTKVSLAVQGFCLLLALSVCRTVAAGGAYLLPAGPYEAPWGIVLSIGPSEAFFTALFLLIAMTLSASSLRLLPVEAPAGRLLVYPSLFHISLVSVLGVLMTGDLFTGFVFLEVSALSSCGLILIARSEDAPLATLKYLVLSSLGSGLFLMGAAYVYGITGHLNLMYLGRHLASAASGYPAVMSVSLALFLTGLGLKSAIFPLHLWLPDAYAAAPTPVTAFFSALSSKAPAILLVKLLYGVYSGSLLAGTAVGPVLTMLGAAGMLGGSLLALRQTRLKRVLAYSSVAQMGYIFLGIGLGSPAGTALALYHMAAHSLSKACLFLSAGTLASERGQALPALWGIGRVRPVTLGIFTVASFSVVGIPILPGFISKFNLSLAALDAGTPWLLGVILLSGLLSAAYYFPIIIRGFFSPGDASEAPAAVIGREGLWEAAPAALLALLLILLALFSGPLLSVLRAGFFIGA